MASHYWKHLHRLPFVFGFVFAVAIFVPLIIAIKFKRVTIYVPYISDGGANFPEAGIFTSCLTIAAFLSQAILSLRYLVVEDFSNKRGNEIHTFLNAAAFVLGSLSTIALIVAASNPIMINTQVHNSAFGTACICFVLYMFCHTWISFLLCSHRCIPTIRLTILICSIICLVSLAIFGVLGSATYTAEHWVGIKTPDDEGFIYFVVSASAGWIIAVLIFLFYASFCHEFKAAVFNFHLETFTTSHKKRPSFAITRSP